jgi:hypothetical protein
VQAHRANQAEHEMLLAIWFMRGGETDLHLLEVFKSWPESGIGELASYPFGPSVVFPLPGRLHLTMAGPKDFRDACRSGHPIILRARADGKVVYEAAKKKLKPTVEALKKAFFHGKA